MDEIQYEHDYAVPMRYRQWRQGFAFQKGRVALTEVMHMKVWEILAFVLKVLPDIIKLVKLIVKE